MVQTPDVRAERSNLGTKPVLCMRLHRAWIPFGICPGQEKRGLISGTGSKGLSAAQVPRLSALSVQQTGARRLNDHSRRRSPYTSARVFTPLWIESEFKRNIAARERPRKVLTGRQVPLASRQPYEIRDQHISFHLSVQQRLHQALSAVQKMGLPNGRNSHRRPEPHRPSPRQKGTR